MDILRYSPTDVFVRDDGAVFVADYDRVLRFAAGATEGYGERSRSGLLFQ